MFDVDTLVDDLRSAGREPSPLLAVREVLDATMAERGAVATALPPTRAELLPLYRSDELTILKVVWAPGMWLQPHDHRMWAAIGVYTRPRGQHVLPREPGTPATASSCRAGGSCRRATCRSWATT